MESCVAAQKVPFSSVNITVSERIAQQLRRVSASSWNIYGLPVRLLFRKVMEAGHISVLSQQIDA